MKPKTAGKIQEREHIIQGLDSDCSPISKEWANGLPSGDEVEKQFPNPKGITKSDSEVKAMYNRRKGANWMKQIASAIIAKNDNEMRELNLEFGLLKIHCDNRIALLNSCEEALCKERAEKEELAIKLNLSGIDNENLRIEVQFLKKENDDLADKYGKSVEENLDLKEKLIELRKENEQLKQK